jgi:hypothetical protein
LCSQNLADILGVPAPICRIKQGKTHMPDPPSASAEGVDEGGWPNRDKFWLMEFHDKIMYVFEVCGVAQPAQRLPRSNDIDTGVAMLIICWVTIVVHAY